MEARELALALTSHRAASGSEPHPLDRIRMQKAVFLLVNRGSESWRNLYTFTPYDWGPYSRDLTSNLDWMISRDWMKVRPVDGSRYGQYEATPFGEEQAERVWMKMSETERDFVKHVRRYVTSRSFSELLREVYAAYPQYATASRFYGWTV